jgi:acetylornithine aminotransferase
VTDGIGRVQEVRGTGLLVGVQLSKSAGGIVGAARAKGVIVITAGAGDVVRIVPPLTCTDEEIDQCVQVLAQCISEL